MAIGRYEIASSGYRPTHVPSMHGASRVPKMPDLAGVFEAANDANIRSGISWYRGVQQFGAALQGIGKKVSAYESDAAANSMINDYAGAGGILA